MTERRWERGNADVTWLDTDPRNGQIREFGLGWVSRPRDPFDRHEIGEVTWVDNVEPEAREPALADMTVWLGRMRDQLASEDTLPLKRRWVGVFAASKALQMENLDVREHGLALFDRAPRPFDLRELNQVTWIARHTAASREIVLVNLTDWLAALRELQGAE